MNNRTFQFELITPCFCGGALPKEQAEIRAPSIRGQLRWWFRTLGGFKSLAGTPVPEQEALIFGSSAGEEGAAGKLIVRVASLAGRKLIESTNHLSPDMAAPEGYLLFPLRLQIRKKSALPSFALRILWRGAPALWIDVCALVTVFGHLGSLGFRSRRAMGALAFQKDTPSLQDARKRFSEPDHITIKAVKAALPFATAEACIPKLGEWLRDWRQHGKSPRLAIQQRGFDYARRDHNEGIKRLTGTTVASNPPGHEPKGQPGQTFRPAIGLPIVQFFSSQPRGLPNKVNWEFSDGHQKGRFASPVILRPHRVGPNQYRPLVIFVDAHAWPQGHKVYLDRQERAVSTDLYQAMKNDDERLTSFP